MTDYEKLLILRALATKQAQRLAEQLNFSKEKITERCQRQIS